MMRHDNLNWSLRYFFSWMKTIGIYQITTNSSCACKFLTPILQYGFWIISVNVNVIQLVFIFQFENAQFQPTIIKTSSFTYFWNDLIESSNWMLHNLGFHCWVLFVALGERKWEKLDKLLSEIHYSSHQSTEAAYSFEKRLERLTIGGIFYIIISVITLYRYFFYKTKINWLFLWCCTGRKLHCN